MTKDKLHRRVLEVLEKRETKKQKADRIMKLVDQHTGIILLEASGITPKIKK